MHPFKYTFDIPLRNMHQSTLEVRIPPKKLSGNQGQLFLSVKLHFEAFALVLLLPATAALIGIFPSSTWWQHHIISLARSICPDPPVPAPKETWGESLRNARRLRFNSRCRMLSPTQLRKMTRIPSV